MSTGDREAEILAGYSLTVDEAERMDVKILAHRVAQSEAAVQRLEDKLAQTVHGAGRGSLGRGHIPFTTAGTPLVSIVELAQGIDLELVRLDERRTALDLVADTIEKHR